MQIIIKDQLMSLAVVLTALPIEYLAVRAYLADLQEEVHPQGTVYERGKFATDNQVWVKSPVKILSKMVMRLQNE